MNATKKMELERLSNNSWLAGLPLDARNELLKTAHFRRYKANQRVVSKNGIADGLYGVMSGEVRASATTLSGDEVVLTRINSGHWFGEIALLDGGVRTHDAYTTMPSEMAILPKDLLIQICDKHPKAYRALVMLLCEHCRQAFAAVDDFLLLGPEQRMAKRILLSCGSLGSTRVDMSQQELGALTGISRQSTNKILKSWEANGWIQRFYRGLEVIDCEALGQLGASLND